MEATNESDCVVRDSIHVGFYESAEFIENNLSIVPTSCGGTSGKILGLQIIGASPFIFDWRDADGNNIGDSLDITGLGVGDYFLHIHDGNGCETISSAYTITDNGDVLLSDVQKTDTHCGQNTASISIIAEPNPDDLLYSIDNGNSWQLGNSFFGNLVADTFFIRAKDLAGCEGVYGNNPVIIHDISGPLVTAVSVSADIDHLANGQIDIAADVSSGSAYFSIDNGNSFQIDDGLFQNLAAGTDTCVVKDDFGCDTTFVVVIERTNSQIIEAIAGDGNTCLGNAAVIPVKFDNFEDVLKFNITLTYDTAILNCDGYINSDPDFEQGLQISILPNSDEIIIAWLGDTPLSMQDGSTLVELVFGSKKEGMSGIDWAALQGESWFYNENLEKINAEYHIGKLTVFSRPQIIMEEEKQLCAGDKFISEPILNGEPGDFHYHWQGPGYNSYDPLIWLNDIQLESAGTYTFTAIDTLGCEESKSVELVVYPNPEISFSDMDTIFADPGFELDAGGDVKFDIYVWNTGDSSRTILPQQEGIYTVTITNAGGCKSTSEVQVLWSGKAFVLPNAFSPDGDGLNDVFKPIRRYDLIKQYHLMIFNRWGQQIFETENPDSGWDGTYNGQASPRGIYVYTIVYKAYPDITKTKTKKGSFTLIR